MRNKNYRKIVDTLRLKGSIGAAISFSERLTDKTRHASDLQVLLSLHLSKPGFLSKTTSNLIDELAEGCRTISSLRHLIQEADAMRKLMKLLNGYPGKKISIDANPLGHGRRIVCFLHNSLPQANAGYATRAHGILKSLTEEGYDVHAYTRPGFPSDSIKSGFTVDACNDEQHHNIEGVRYARISSTVERGQWEYGYMLDSFYKYINIIAEVKPALVLGRSTYLVSFPAMLAAKAMDTPFFYEVSGLWEVVHESRENPDLGLISRIRSLETLTCANAIHIFTMTQAMKDEICSRGINPTKVSLAPNCASEWQHPQDSSTAPPEKREVFNFGYIGSFQFYEGIEDLIDAFDLLLSNDPGLNIRLYLIGDGPWSPKVNEKASKSTHSNKIVLTGRVGKVEVFDFYRIMNLCVYPRKPLPVTEMVSPVKPLEAMLMKVPVLMSDVKALSELSCEGEHSLLFSKGSVPALAEKMLFSLNNKSQINLMAIKAHAWVKACRNWSTIARHMSNQFHLFS